MSRKATKRRFLFDLYAQNWAAVKREPYIVRVEPDVDDVFVCPLCFKFFTREALSYSDVLSLEHVPPESLGGSDAECTLTCTDCNSKAGSRLESQLKTKLVLDDAGLVGTSFDIEYSPISGGEDIWLPATYERVSDHTMTIVGHPNRSNPNSLEKVTSDRFASSITGVKIRFRGFKPFQADVALLKSAYLHAFRVFGYGVVSNVPMEAVRTQIREPDGASLQGRWISERAVPDATRGVSVIREPRELQSLLVVFDLKSHHRIRRLGVFLPKHDDTKLQIYRQLASVSSNTRIALELTHIEESIDLVKNPMFCSYSRVLWA